MKPIILIHGGAGPNSDFIRNNIEAYKCGLRDALATAYRILESNGSALDAVEAAVRNLEDNPLFNSGRGSALTEEGRVEMCASIMDGNSKESGAVAIVTGVRHPISLARKILHEKNTAYLGAHGAEKFAVLEGIELKPDEWFISHYQKEVFDKNIREQKEASGHGTVGAVAVDMFGNIAAATSTGGLDFCRSGRIADSSMIGVGCYADNKTCAVSCTGDGELIMKTVLGHSIVSEVKYTGLSLSICADHIIHGDNEELEGDLGAIVINASGDYAFSFNTERMHRGIQREGFVEVSIYQKENTNE